MRVILFSILSTLVISLNAKDEKSNVGNVDCEVLQTAYCCYSLMQYESNAQDSLFVKLAQLMQKAKDDGRTLDDLVTSNVQSPQSDIEEKRKVLGLDEVFARAADGNMTEDEIVQELVDRMLASGLKKDTLEELMRQNCPNLKLKILGDRMVMQDPSLFMKENMLSTKQVIKSDMFKYDKYDV